MADVPVIRINIDSSEYDEFAGKWEKFRQQLAETPDKWTEVNDRIRDAGAALQEASAAGGGIGKTLTDPKTDRALSTFTAKSKTISDAWHKIDASLGRTSRNLTGFGRMMLGISGPLGAVAGIGIGVGAAALGATKKAADDFAAQNLKNRQLKIAPGVSQAFKDQFGATLGADDGDIEKFSSIKQNQGAWSQLINATAGRVSANDIQTLDPVDLYLKSLEASARAKDSFGQAGGQWAATSGANDLFGTGTLNAAQSYDHNWFQKQHDAFTDERDKVAQAQPDLDRSTQFVTKWNADLTELKTSFEKALMPLEPRFLTLEKRVSGAIDAFVKDGGFDKVIGDAETAFDKLETAGNNVESWGQGLLKSLGIEVDKNGAGTVTGGVAATAWDQLKKTFADRSVDLAGGASGIDPNSASLMGGTAGDKTGADANARNKAWLARFLPWADHAADSTGAWVKDYLTGGGNYGMPGSLGKNMSIAPGAHMAWTDFGGRGQAVPGGSKRNNPGNLREPGKTKGFASFDSVDDGVRAMDHQLQLYANRDHLNTIRGMVSKYAPSSENDTDGYIRYLEKATGFKSDQRLDMSDPNTRAIVEAGMIQHESPNFKELDTKQVLAAITNRVDSAADAPPAQQADNGSAAQRQAFRMPSSQQAPGVINLTIKDTTGASINIASNMLPR